MKKFFLICSIILVLSLIAGFCVKDLFPDAKMIVSNVDAVQADMLLTYSESPTFEEDIESIVDQNRQFATDSSRRMSVMKVAVRNVAFIGQMEILYDCEVLEIFEGDEISTGTNIQIHQDPGRAINYQTYEDHNDFLQFCESEGYNPAWIEAAKDVNVFYYNSKSPLKADHTYLLFVSCFELGQETHYILADSYDYAETISKPVVEGCLAKYSDYPDNEVYCPTQEAVDRYNEMKTKMLKKYS